MPSLVLSRPEAKGVAGKKYIGLWNVSSRLALVLGLIMVLAILGTVLGGRVFGLMFAPALLLIVLFFAARGQVVIAVGTYFAYEGLEGMFKYLSDFSPIIYVIRPLLLGAIIVLWRLSLVYQERHPVALPMEAILTIFALWGFVEVLNPHGSSLGGSIATLALYYIEPICLYIIGYNVIRTKRQISLFLYSFIAVCTVVSACAVLQFIMGHSWTEAHFPGYHGIGQTGWFILDDKGGSIGSFRPASTTAMGGGGAPWAQWGGLLSLGMLFLPNISNKQRVSLAACLIVNIIGLLITGVRLWLITGIVEALIFVFVIASTPAEVTRSLGILLAATILASVAFAGAQSLSGGIIGARYADTVRDPLAKFQHDRGYNVTSFSDFAKNYPLGAGYQMELGRYTAHAIEDPATLARNGETEFGAITGDMGVPGLLMLYGMVLGILALGWRSFRRLRDPHLRTVGALLFASLTGYLVASFGGPVLQGATYFWFASSVLLALPLVEKHERKLLAKDVVVERL